MAKQAKKHKFLKPIPGQMKLLRDAEERKIPDKEGFEAFVNTVYEASATNMDLILYYETYWQMLNTLYYNNDLDVQILLYEGVNAEALEIQRRAS